MRASVLFVLLLIALRAWSAPVAIGSTSIELPTPRGFAVLTPQMAKAYELQQQLVPPTNAELVSFLPEGSVAAAFKIGDPPPYFARSFDAQTLKTLTEAS